ncbi:hypothetical protein HMI55_005997 [Coelomomyces lativittatus]|nr:hypothetical protein HMI55_005997 [Coelomomyces lativittatus]
MWNKIKDATAYLTPTKPEDEDVNSALRDYYSKKGGPVPDFLKPQSESRPDDSSLQRFEQRQQGPRPVRPRRRA